MDTSYHPAAAGCWHAPFAATHTCTPLSMYLSCWPAFGWTLTQALRRSMNTQINVQQGSCHHTSWLQQAKQPQEFCHKLQATNSVALMHQSGKLTFFAAGRPLQVSPRADLPPWAAQPAALHQCAPPHIACMPWPKFATDVQAQCNGVSCCKSQSGFEMYLHKSL